MRRFSSLACWYASERELSLEIDEALLDKLVEVGFDRSRAASQARYPAAAGEPAGPGHPGGQFRRADHPREPGMETVRSVCASRKAAYLAGANSTFRGGVAARSTPVAPAFRNSPEMDFRSRNASGFQIKAFLWRFQRLKGDQRLGTLRGAESERFGKEAEVG